MASALDRFTPEEIERARRYHRPSYGALALDAVLGFAVLVLLVFAPLGHAIARGLARLPWPLATLAEVGVAVGASFVVRLPVTWWRGFVHERAWGFSTQAVGGWAADRAKGLAVALVLTGVVLLGLVAVARALPHAWPLVLAPAAGGLVLFLSFVAPIALEPVFNRFEPLADAELAARLLALSVRVGVPVREVLVADASRRTRKENAYVSGLGATRRVVVYDTLLRRADGRQLELVVAHELGHRRLRHVLQGTLLAVGGALATVVVLWALLQWSWLGSAIGARGAGDPRVVPFVLLTAGALEALALPWQSTLSRRWERAADRFSLDVTGDVDVFVASHRDLAVANLADLAPPPAIYLWVFSHPTAPERIADALARAGEVQTAGGRHQIVTTS